MRHNIEAERARMQLKQEDVAKKLGISQKTYSAYVREERAIPSDKLILMSQLFHCSTDYLLGLNVSVQDLPHTRAG